MSITFRSDAVIHFVDSQMIFTVRMLDSWDAVLPIADHDNCRNNAKMFIQFFKVWLLTLTT